MITLSAFSMRSQIIEGIYSNRWEASSGEAIEYTLTLNDNGTFTFITDRKHLEETLNSIEIVEGSWTYNDRLLTLNTHPEENPSELASNLDANNARYHNISPRNPNLKSVKPSFKFYKSKVFYTKDMELFKTEIEVSATD